MIPSIHAVVVTYYPEAETFTSLVSELLRQVNVVHIVDNTSAEDDCVSQLLTSLSGRIRLVRLGENFGIAKALNEGINAALKEGCTHILTMDQDSLVSSGMIAKLLNATQELMKQGQKVAAVAPVYYDVYRKISKPFQQVRDGRLIKIFPTSNQDAGYSEILTAITSGCLYPISVFEHVGFFENDLFIDHVDHEWCFRAQVHGFKVFCCWEASMNHLLGDSTINISFTKRRITIHSPLRNYYFFRNALSLFKRDYVPFIWKLFMVNTLFFKLIEAIIFCNPRIIRLRLILKGVWHGLVGKMGKFNDTAA